MRLMEVLLIINYLIIVILSLLKTSYKEKAIRYLSVSGLILFIIHFIIEGSRWQMYPIYMITVIYFIYFIYSFKNQRKNITFPKTINIIILIMIIISTMVSIKLPVKFVAKPEGPFPVGTFTTVIEDRNRPEIYTNDPDDYRKFTAQFWYPTNEGENTNLAPWLPGDTAVPEGLARMVNLPPFTMSYLKQVNSNSYLNADFLDDNIEHPVIIISHGWQGFKNIHTDIAEYLASNGYIVAAVNHTYGSIATRYPDGQTIFLKESALPSRDDDNFLQAANILVNTYASDIVTMLDKLKEYNAGNTILAGSMDLNKVGVIGHSTGGGGTVKAAMVDSRIKIVLGLDPWVEPITKKNIEKGLQIPALYLRSESWEDSINNENLSMLVKHSNETKVYSIAGTEHEDFTIMPRIVPVLDYLNMSGPITENRMWQIESEFIGNFFNKNLKGSTAKKINKIEDKFSEVNEVHFQ